MKRQLIVDALLYIDAHYGDVLLLAVQCKPDQWCLVFVMDYISGTPRSDDHENSEVLLLPAAEAIKREDITNMSRELLAACASGNYTALQKSEYIPSSTDAAQYVLFGT